MTQTLAAVIHGESGAGKSYFGGTVPAPRLILDAEGGSRFIKANKRRVSWDPLTQAVPDMATVVRYDSKGNELGIGADACFVQVQEWKSLYAAYEVLASGAHTFRSVVVDSLTEAQKRLVDDVAGVDQPSLQEWGVIGRHLEDMVRKMRDLTFHKTTPINVVMLCLSHLRDGQTRPFLKGALELALPAFVDVVSYLYTTTSEDPTKSGGLEHYALLSPHNDIIAKDRTAALVERYGAYATDANFSEWLEILEAEFGS